MLVLFLGSMEENEVNKIMDNITDDSSLCIIREALGFYSPERIKELIKESETELKNIGVTFDEVINCKGNYFKITDGDEANANFSTGRISALKDLLNN